MPTPESRKRLVRQVVPIARELAKATGQMQFAAPVACVYNPLDYAWRALEAYLERYVQPGIEAILLGMNPGPFGMVQTGIPFGDVQQVRAWLGIEMDLARPTQEHPARPIEGFACTRSEVSGTRLWGWAQSRFGTPNTFFRRFFVWNYCPLAFLEASGKNRTPDKLSAAERETLFPACDHALRALVGCLEPRYVLGIGGFAAKRAQLALANQAVRLGTILHPSPANPSANRGWAKQAEQQLHALGIDLDRSHS